MGKEQRGKIKPDVAELRPEYRGIPLGSCSGVPGGTRTMHRTGLRKRGRLRRNTAISLALRRLLYEISWETKVESESQPSLGSRICPKVGSCGLSVQGCLPLNQD